MFNLRNDPFAGVDHRIRPSAARWINKETEVTPHSPRHIEREHPLHVHSSLDAISTSFDDVGVFYGNDYEERIQSWSNNRHPSTPAGDQPIMPRTLNYRLVPETHPSTFVKKRLMDQ